MTKQLEPASTGAFLIDLEKKIRFSARCSPYVGKGCWRLPNISLFIDHLFAIGRNWYEVIRQFDALMMSTFHPLACPSNWGQGQQELLKKEVESKDAPEYRGLEIRPWFRLTACPDKF